MLLNDRDGFDDGLQSQFKQRFSLNSRGIKSVEFEFRNIIIQKYRSLAADYLIMGGKNPLKNSPFPTIPKKPDQITLICIELNTY